MGAFFGELHPGMEGKLERVLAGNNQKTRPLASKWRPRLVMGLRVGGTGTVAAKLTLSAQATCRRTHQHLRPGQDVGASF